jgi:uncharacterized protein YqhQ
VDRYPKEHVRCGTNFLIIVMIITIFVFTLFGTPSLLWRILSRVIAIPIIAAISYEVLRLGARYPGSLAMKAMMAPGIWLQKITTQQPDPSQIEVAITSFRELLRREAEAIAPDATDTPTPPPGTSDPTPPAPAPGTPAPPAEPERAAEA